MRALRYVAGILLALVASSMGLAQDQVIRVEERQFRVGAGRITFSEVPRGTGNPVYPPQLYGAGPEAPTVRFGGFFVGRRIANPADCPTGAVLSGCLSGAPATPLELDPRAPRVISVDQPATDMHGRTPPVLVGTPFGNGPVAIWFDRDVAGVGLDGVGFDAVGGTAITVYDRQGRVLGRTVNRKIGVDFMGLATVDGTARIAGLEFHLVGPEPLGFGVDNIRFASPQQIDMPTGAAPLTPRRPIILP
jgi:hypothetical protein